MYNLRKELGKEFVENTLNTLHEKVTHKPI